MFDGDFDGDPILYYYFASHGLQAVIVSSAETVSIRSCWPRVNDVNKCIKSATRKQRSLRLARHDFLYECFRINGLSLASIEESSQDPKRTVSWIISPGLGLGAINLNP